MAQLAKCLPHKNEDPQKKVDMAMYTCKDNLAKLESFRFSERPWFTKLQGARNGGDTQH